MPRVGNQHVYGPWVHGWNASKPSDDLAPSEIYDGENIRIFPDGSARQRSGSTPFNTVISGNPTIDSFGQHKFDSSTKKIWAIAGGAFYEDTSGIGTGLTDRTNSETITAGKKWSMVDANGTLIGHNGVTGDIIIKWASAGGNIAALDVDSRFTTAKYWEFWDNRAWAGNLSSGTDRVWRSGLANIESWGSTAFFQQGSIVTGLKKMSNFLVIHGDDIIHLLVPTGNAATPYRKVPKQAKGTIAPFSISTITLPGAGEVQVYIRADGIYSFDGNISRKLSERMDGGRYWESLNASALENAFSCDYPARNEVWFYLPYDASFSMNNVLVYNYRMNIFYPRWSGTARNTCAILNALPYSGGISDGYIYDNEPELFNDNDGSTGNAIEAWMQTSSIAPGGETEQCRWLWCRTSFDIIGDFDIEFTATMPTSPEVEDTIVQGGTFDAIGVDFTIDTSTIAGEDTIVNNVDSLLLGYDPHVQVKYRNATSGEEFSIRKATLVYRPIGQTHKRGTGVI